MLFIVPDMLLPVDEIVDKWGCTCGKPVDNWDTYPQVRESLTYPHTYPQNFGGLSTGYPQGYPQ
jgi:hypothetical protein